MEFESEKDAMSGIEKTIQLYSISQIDEVLCSLNTLFGEKVYPHDLRDLKKHDLRIGWKIGNTWVFIRLCNLKNDLFDMALRRVACEKFSEEN